MQLEQKLSKVVREEENNVGIEQEDVSQKKPTSSTYTNKFPTKTKGAFDNLIQYLNLMDSDLYMFRHV